MQGNGEAEKREESTFTCAVDEKIYNPLVVCSAINTNVLLSNEDIKDTE